jgi:hypothetical protein
VDRDLFRNFETDPSLPVFAPKRPDREMAYYALRCPCGIEVFRLTGWPRIVSGRGSFFWRSVARVWREARLPMQDGEAVASPFWLPISTCCHGCGREETLFDGERMAGRMALSERAEPRESIRCRVCRRGLVELVVGIARAAALDERVGSPSAVEIVSRCHGCHRQARIAWSDLRRSEQEIRLDLLYGRR